MTKSQLVKNPRIKKKIKKDVTFKKGPYVRAVCLSVGKSSPRKPNSGKRSTVKVRLISTKKDITVYIPGIGHSVREHSVILVRGGGPKDLPGVNKSVVRGALDDKGVVKRNTARSKYGKSKEK